MGRDRKVLSMNKKHLTKKEIEERRAAEESYTLKRDELKAAEYMKEESRKEYERILKNAFWLDNLDRNLLSVYVTCFVRMQEILKEMNQEEYSEVIEMRGKDGTPKVIQNPLLRAMREYSDEMRKISGKLGLATIDRLKLAAPKEKKEENKFAKFLR